MAKPSTTLPYNALPLSFRLLRPLGTGTSPSVCLSVQLPLVDQGASAAPAADEDLRHGPPSPTVEVLRLIDPEHREPFVSLGRILLACAVTPIEALLRYNLDRLDYSTTLGGLAPFLDLWVPLKTARKIATDLGRLDELAALLEWETRGAYSCEDKEEGGIVHNWKIDSTRIPPAEYSTASMLATPFPRIHLLPPGAQVRALLPSLLTFPSLQDRPTDARPSLDAVWGRVVEWSIVAFEGWVDRGQAGEEDGGGGGRGGLQGRRTLESLLSLSTAGSAPSLGEGTDTDELAPLFLFSTLAPLLLALDLLPPPAPSPSSPSSSANSTPPPRPSATTLSHLPSLPPLPRAALLAPSSRTDLDGPRLPPHAQLYLVDAVARLVMHARRMRGGEEGARRAARGAGKQEEQGDEGRGEAARADDEPWRTAMEARLAALERGGGGASESAAGASAGVSARAAVLPDDEGEGGQLGGAILRDRLASVEAQLEAVQAALWRQQQDAHERPPAPVDLAAASPSDPSRTLGANSTRTVEGVLAAVLVLMAAVGGALIGRWLASWRQAGASLSESRAV